MSNLYDLATVPLVDQEWDEARHAVFAAANAGTIDARQTLALCALLLDGQAAQAEGEHAGMFYTRPNDAYFAAVALAGLAVPADGSDPADGVRPLAAALTWTPTGRDALAQLDRMGAF